MTILPSTTILNKYKIIQEIGQGAGGHVWLAEEIVFGSRPVAIKEARSDLPPAQMEMLQHRYKQEVQIYAALQRIQAPNIVPVYTVEPYDESLLLVMAYMSNGDLEHALRRLEGGLPVNDALEVMATILRALQAAHEHTLEIVHRDVKPSNILFDGTNRAHLADFGLAQLGGTSGRSQLEGARNHPGTPAYMAPEQESSTGYLTPAADIYAAGCVLFEMLTGKRYKRVRPGSKPSTLRPEVPNWLDALVAQALAADPFDRFEDAGEMLRDLQTGRTQIVSEQERRQAEAERQRQAERQHQAEVEKERQAEVARQAEIERERQTEAEREAEAERQRQAEQQRQAEVEKEHQAEVARQAEIERQRQAEAERQKQAEAERQREAEAERQRQAEATRQAEVGKQRYVEIERQRQQQTVTAQQSRIDTDKQQSTRLVFTILKVGLVAFWSAAGVGLLSSVSINDYFNYNYFSYLVILFPTFLFWTAVGHWAVLHGILTSTRWWPVYSLGAYLSAAMTGAVGTIIFGSTLEYATTLFLLVCVLESVVFSTIQWLRLRRHVQRAYLWIVGSTVLGMTTVLLNLSGPYWAVGLASIIYMGGSSIILWWLLKYQARQSTVATDGDIVHPVELWRRITASPAGNFSGIPVTLGKKWRFLAEWVAFSVLGLIIAAMPALYLGASSGGPEIVIPLLLFGMAAGQWIVLRSRLTSSRWWLIYSAIGGAAATVAGMIGSQFSNWPSPTSYIGMFFLQLLLASTSQWLRLREYVQSAFVWPVSNVVVGTAVWILGAAVSSTWGAWASVLPLAYLLILGVTMWWLLAYHAKQVTSLPPENG